MDDDGIEVASGETGELWIAGPMVVPGYWANPEATAASFTAGHWHSGDLGSIDAEGYVRVFDRKKDMLNRGGYKIFSVEVENVLMAWPGMVEAAIVGRPCPVLGERVHAFVLVPGAAPDDAALRAFCAARLADYKVPETITWRTEPLPRNANGKLMKRLMRAELTPLPPR
jgi:O-succinylbenzoic acid--CoA ligase